MNYLVFSASPKLHVDVERKVSIAKSLKKASANVDLGRPVKDEVNILLLGVTGIGKSTLINALANYLVNNTLEQAVNDRMQVLIPFIFHHTDPETFDDKVIVHGEDDEYEQIMESSQTGTLKCRSFVFRIGDRLLRFIDTPPLCDTRGFEQDIQNMDEIMTYIARYKYLHGISILLKPNEGQPTRRFRYCLLEFLKYLPKNVLENIIYIFTNTHSTFYRLGNTVTILRAVFDGCHQNYDVRIPFQESECILCR